MERKTLKRLITCLDMMSSDQDGEALAAARMAAKIVKENKLEWGKIVFVPIDEPKAAAPVVNQPAPAPVHHPAAQPQTQYPFGAGMGGMGQQGFGDYNNAMHQQYQQQSQEQWRHMHEAMRNQAQYSPPPRKETKPEESVSPDFTEKEKRKRGMFGFF